MKILHAHYFETKKERKKKENKGCRIAFNDKWYSCPTPSHSQPYFSEATNFNSSELFLLGFSGGSGSEESACKAGHLGEEDPLEKGMATHSSVLAWRVLWTGASGYSPWNHKESDTTEWLTQIHRQLFLLMAASTSLNNKQKWPFLGLSTVDPFTNCQRWRTGI